jgi:hypothetical protein
MTKYDVNPLGGKYNGNFKYQRYGISGEMQLCVRSIGRGKIQRRRRKW